VKFQRQILQRRDELGAGQLLLEFFREVDQKPESYIETSEVLNEHPGIVKRLKKASKGKHYPMEKFVKKHGLE